MNALASLIQQGLKVMQPLTGDSTFRWSTASGADVDVDCVPSSDREANSVIPGGFQDDSGFTLAVLLEDWITADSTIITVDSTLYTSDSDGRSHPITGRKIRFRGKRWTIENVNLAACGSHYDLTLTAATKQ
jgi:hypothetical protein